MNVTLEDGTEVTGVFDPENCKVRLDNGKIEDEEGTEWEVEQVKEWCEKMKGMVMRWEKLFKWLEEMPQEN